jgi:Putative abortive phage resistance protein AbiGi, antitoxin
MNRLQRYVSRELTHFVGRKSKDDEARYNLLKRILSSGKLEPRHRGSILFPDTYSVDMSNTAKLSTNKVYETETVCFCDIPVEDFEVHMRKYSRFGLSFQKSFLIKKEANPVFYIASDAADHFPAIPGRPLQLGRRKITRADTFDAFFDKFRNIYDRLFPWVALNGPGRKEVPEKLMPILEELMIQRHFINDLFSYLKFFDARKSEISATNFYMEREWRIRGTLKFDLNNVWRIIVPTKYARRLRRDFGEFYGQITFSD